MTVLPSVCKIVAKVGFAQLLKSSGGSGWVAVEVGSLGGFDRDGGQRRDLRLAGGWDGGWAR